MEIVPVTSESPTKWYDDNPSYYRPWASGEPDTANKCILHTLGGFRDTSCDADYKHLCKITAGKVLVYSFSP